MRISDWSSDVCSSDLAAGGAGDQADLVVESVHGEFPCGWTWIVAGAGAGGHCLFVRCCAWRGRLAHFPGAESSTAGSSTGTPSALQLPASHRCPRSAGVEIGRAHV